MDVTKLISLLGRSSRVAQRLCFHTSRSSELALATGGTSNFLFLGKLRSQFCESVKIKTVQRHLHSRFLSSTSSNDEGNNQVIYKGTLSKRVLRVKMLSMGGSIMGLLITPQALVPVWETSLGAATVFITLSSFFIVGTPLLLHWMCRRYVMELQFDPDSKTFRATVLTLFFKKRHIVYTADEVRVPGTPLLLTSFVVRGYPLLVNLEDFTDIDVYKHMMGYDKPIDFMMKSEKES